MNKRTIWALAVLNAALLCALVFRNIGDNTALAQQQRKTGDVIMIPGGISSGSTSVIYLLDTSNHQLSAMAYTSQGMEFMAPPVDLDRVFSAAGTVGGAGSTGSRKETRTR